MIYKLLQSIRLLAAVALGLGSAEEFERLVKSDAMTGPTALSV